MLYVTRTSYTITIIAFAIVTAWRAAGPCAAAEPARAGPGERVTVQSVIGSADIVSPGASAAKPARVGMRVLLGSAVRTGPESSDELVFETGTVLHIGESSVVTLSSKMIEIKGSSPDKRKDAL